jgi:chromosome segregation ATPase
VSKEPGAVQTEALSPEEQITSLRLEVAQYRAAIAELTTERDANQSKLAEAAVFKARLTTALLEIEHMKAQLATLRVSATGSPPRSWTATSPSSRCGWRISRKT